MKNNRSRARIGVLVPYTNSNLEQDMILMRPEAVSLHFTRLGGYDENAIPDETQMSEMGAQPIDEALRLVSGVKPDVVMYGCTSATLTHGTAFDRALAQRIRDASGAETVTAAGALVFALNALGVKRIGFASPYVAAINHQAMAFLADSGFESVSRGEVGEALDNTGQGALTPQEVHSLGCMADSTRAQAIVLSCTDMRSVEAISQLENTLGKPVVTSNQAMLFEAMHKLGMRTAGHPFGELFNA